MSPIGHTITAYTLTATFVRVSNVQVKECLTSVYKLMSSGDFAYADRSTFVILVSMGIMVGARGPDRLEIPSFNRKTKTRHSIISHRTLTHWPPLWVALTYICWSALLSSHDFLIYSMSSVAVGFCAAGWLHLTMDIMTPMGIPLLTPFGTRFSFELYRTSHSGEWLCILLFLLICYLIQLMPLRIF
jgi:membrane-bound metal-dependent hydrolase YbcI (DUF457 family)